MPRNIIGIIEMHQEIGTTPELGYASQAQALENADEFVSPGVVHIDDPLGPPFEIDLGRKHFVGRRNAAGTAAARGTACASDASQGHQFRRADDNAIGAEGDGLGDIVGVADTAARHQGHLLPGAFIRKKMK